MLPKMKEQRGRLDYEYLEMFSDGNVKYCRQQMRSILTMLGIIIGITAVIALVSLMSGMTSEITDAFEEMGIESINVSIQDRSATKEVKPEEMEQLAEEHSDIIAGQSPTVSMPAFIKNGSDTISTQATGVNEYYLGMKKYNITYGRELTYVDVERKQKVCVIGTYIAKEVFGGDALGKSIQITVRRMKLSEYLKNRTTRQKILRITVCIYHTLWRHTQTVHQP